jgi:catechol 2,3-dioxygenase-like lactoylglutathione lyase family enzyme
MQANTNLQLNSFYPVIGTNRLAASRDFYTQKLGFEITYEADWYISLKHPAGYELALLNPQHETVPADFRQPLSGLLLLNFEVEDVDAVYQNLITKQKLPLHLPLRDEVFGQRHFITSDPNGVLIDVIKVIPPDEREAQNYVSSAQSE